MKRDVLCLFAGVVFLMSQIAGCTLAVGREGVVLDVPPPPPVVYAPPVYYYPYYSRPYYPYYPGPTVDIYIGRGHGGWNGGWRSGHRR